MTAPSTVCPSCGEDVPFGRRTCEACGANVTTASEPHETMSFDEEAVGEAAAPEAPAVLDDAGWDAQTGPAELTTREAMIPEADVPGAMIPEAVAPMPAQAAAPEPAKAAAPAEQPPFIPPVLREWNAGSVIPESGFATELAVAEAEPTGLAGAWLPPSATPPEPVLESASNRRRVVEPAADVPAAHATAADLLMPAGATPTPAIAPPSGAMPATLAAMLNRTETTGPRWPGGAEGGAGGLDSRGPTMSLASDSAAMVPPRRMPDLDSATHAAALAPERQPLQPGRAPLFADLPFDAPDTLPGWLVAGGGGLATLSFLLPWVSVIDSYFSAWGLGSVANLPAFLVAFGTTALAILPSRLADWLRHGILGLTVGSFLLGLTWSRLVGATGGQLGVVLEAAGALLLLIGGILAIVRNRSGADGSGEGR